jgi:CRISPR/Cas system-associated exonuclease Cas4 (RecB family)
MRYPRDHYSYSAFSKFWECPRRWWFDYVRYPEEKEDIFAFQLGNAYHDSVAMLYEGKPLEEALASFEQALPIYSHKVRSQIENIREALIYYSTIIYPQYRSRVKSVEVEKKVNLLGLDIPITFRMDLVTTDGVLVDHKTVGARAPGIEYSEQLDLYAALYMQSEGNLPRCVEYHLAYKQPGKKDRVEIKYKSPTLPEVLKTVSKVRASLEMIKHDILPTSRGAHCAYCPFVSECDNLIVTSDGDHTI